MLPRTIMTLDLENAFSDAFLLSLEIAGYEVFRMDNASDALLMAASHSPDVLLLSANFDDIRNVDLVREFSRHAERMECVLVCDTDDLMVLAELYDCGNVHSHRPRPKGNYADLHRDIARAMERSAMRTQNGYLLVQLRDAREELHKLTEYMSYVENRIAAAKIGEDMLDASKSVLMELNGLLDDLMPKISSRQGKSALLKSKTRIDGLLNTIRHSSNILCEENQSEKMTDVHEMMNNVLAALDNLLQRRRISVQTSYVREKVSLPVDEKSLHQAFIHLILNSVEAMHDGGALEIRTGVLEGDPPGIRIVLKDSGKGIPADVQPYIFEPFFTTHSIREGTGLGLAVAKSVIEECDGVLSIESKTGEGTTVIVTFPGAIRESPPSKWKTGEKSNVTQTNDDGSGERHSHHHSLFNA